MILLRITAAGQGWHTYSPLAEKTVFSGKYSRYDLSGKRPEDSWLTRDTELAKDYYADPRSQFSFSLNGFYGLVDAVYYANDRLLMKQDVYKRQLGQPSGTAFSSKAPGMYGRFLL